ncbi:MAG: tetratricopeptide repeat protein [Verrucomicrobia bacterium]|jgi:tetratricopeptide (TPR) repeat protein|nr:tetratricopeptide repeat protein [Verrucomicrobiota bacterium]
MGEKAEMGKAESRNGRDGKIRRVLSLCAAGVVMLLTTAGGLAAANAPRLEPTVSPKEAERLAEAAATTNLSAAVAMLQTRDLPKASAAMDFAIGNFQFQDGVFRAAAQSYRDAIAKLPSFRNARKNLGRVCLMMGQNEEAIRIYQDLVQEGLVDSDTLLLLGHGLARQDHVVSAENAYRQVLLLDPHSTDAQHGLIRCLLQQERHREARSLLRTALSAGPHRAELWSLLANVNIALDATREATAALETARRLGTSTPDMLGLLGDLYLNAEQPSHAVACYQDALQAGWRDGDRLLRAAESFVLVGDSAAATRLLESINTEEADLTQRRAALKLRAEIAILESRSEEAIGMYRKLCVEDPLDGKALLRLGELLQQSGDFGGAELAIERAGRLDGLEAEAKVQLAQFAVERRQYAKAVVLLEAAQTLDAKSHVERYLKQVRRLAER